MTQIKFDFGHPSADGIADLGDERIHVVPTERFRNGSRIVVRDSFEVRLDEHGTATVTVPPPDDSFAYEVLNFSDLVEVDSTTLTPVQTGNPLADIDQSDVDWAVSAINA